MSAWRYHYSNPLSNGEADLGAWSWKTEVESWKGDSAGELRLPGVGLPWPCCGLSVQIHNILYFPKLVWIGPLWLATKESWVKPHSNISGAIRPEKNVLPVELLLCSAQPRLVWMKPAAGSTYHHIHFFPYAFCFHSFKTYWLWWARATLYVRDVQTNHIGSTLGKVMIEWGKKWVAGQFSLA